MTTPLTPKEESHARRDPIDFMLQQSPPLAWSELNARLLATLDRERRERVDPDLLARALREVFISLEYNPHHQPEQATWPVAGQVLAAEYNRLTPPGERVDPDPDGVTQREADRYVEGWLAGNQQGHRERVDPDLRAAIEDALYGLGTSGETMVRIEEAFAAVDTILATPDHTVVGEEPTLDLEVPTHDHDTYMHSHGGSRHIHRFASNPEATMSERVDPDLLSVERLTDVLARLELNGRVVWFVQTDDGRVPAGDIQESEIAAVLRDAILAATEAPREGHEHVPMDRPLRGDSDYGIGGDFCRVCGERMPTPATPDHTEVGEEREAGITELRRAMLVALADPDVGGLASQYPAIYTLAKAASALNAAMVGLRRATPRPR